MIRFAPRACFVALLLTFISLSLPGVVVADDAPATAEKEGAETKKAAPAKRRPLLWMIEGSPRVFLYGTIHVADPRVTAHLPVVQAALDQSTALYTELSLSAAGMQQMQMAVMMRAPMPDQTLLTAFGADLHGRVSTLMPPSMPFAMLQNMKPWLIQFLLQLTLLKDYSDLCGRIAAREAKESEAKGGSSSTGSAAKPAAGAAEPLDAKLFHDAEKAGKHVGGLESIDTQISVFDSLSIEAQVKMVSETVKEIEKNRAIAKKAKESGKPEVDDSALGKMVAMWLAGDDAGFNTLIQTELKSQSGPEAEKFVKGLLDTRNVGMAAKIQELMKTHADKTLFVAVGSAHMPGKVGLITLLTRAGLKLRRMELGDELPAQPAKKDAAKKAETPKREPVGAGK